YLGAKGWADAAGDDLARGGECRRPRIIPERAGIGENGEFYACILGQEMKRGLQVKACTPIIGAAERVPENAGVRRLPEIAWPNACRRKPAHQIGSHLEVIEHPQALAPNGRHLPALHM